MIMMWVLLLAIVLSVAEGDPLLHAPSLHLHNDDLLNDIQKPHPSPNLFHYMFNHNGDELTTADTYRVGPLFKTIASGDAGAPGDRRTVGESPSSPTAVSLQDSFSSESTAESADEGQNGEGMMLDIVDTGATETLVASERTSTQETEHRQTTTSSSRKDSMVTSRQENPRDEPHRRQKRFILGNKLRTIAVPLSVFNFLGFLPVRVPGLPYHNDLPSPDYSHYNTMYEVYEYIPRRRRRFRFYD